MDDFVEITLTKKDKYALEDNTAIEITPPNPYPINLKLVRHPFIDEMEIPADNYIKIKIRGIWTTIYLPLEYL